jgi:hypothetical protein
MSFTRQLLGVMLLGAITSAPASLHAQTRFTVLARESVATTPTLEILTLRDATQGSCYLLFTLDLSLPSQTRVVVQPTDVAEAAARRDRRFAELNRAYEQSFGSLYVGTPANALPYQFEAQKIQADFERVLREQELTRLEAQLERILTAPKVAVSGPAPCGTDGSATGTTGR